MSSSTTDPKLEVDVMFLLMQTPYLHGGRTFAGADCYGALILWYRLFLGIELWDLEEEYPADWKFKGKKLFIENYHRQWDRVEVPVRHDVVLFQVGGQINHAGIYLGKGNFFHICRAGGCIGRLEEPGWRKRVEGFYRYRKPHEDHN